MWEEKFLIKIILDCYWFKFLKGIISLDEGGGGVGIFMWKVRYVCGFV